MGKLTVIIPAYNEEATIPQTVRTVTELLTGEGIPFELLFVDDGSADGTWEALVRACGEDERVCAVRLSRNFGKDPAVFAGLAHAAGDCVAVMDCDLQHPPEVLIQMYHLWEQGYQVVRGMKQAGEKRGLFYRLFARTFNAFLSRASKADMTGASDFILMDRIAVQALLSYRERDAFFRVQASSIGFKRVDLPFTVAQRTAGTTKWSFFSLARYAVRGITASTGAPLYLAFFEGAFATVLAVLCSVLYAADVISGGAVACICLFALAALLISVGALGAYVYKLWRQCCNRPQYLIAERCGVRNHEENN